MTKLDREAGIMNQPTPLPDDFAEAVFLDGADSSMAAIQTDLTAVRRICSDDSKPIEDRLEAYEDVYESQSDHWWGLHRVITRLCLVPRRYGSAGNQEDRIRRRKDRVSAGDQARGSGCFWIGFRRLSRYEPSLVWGSIV